MATNDFVLFSAYQAGALHLKNRIVMAPLTRSRSRDAGVPPPFAAEYYAQRAGAGMIVSEAGVDSKVSAVVYVAARAPDAGEDYTALAARFSTPPATAGISATMTPSVTGVFISSR